MSQYPLDLTGVSPANLIKNEMHSIDSAKYRDYYFIVPNCSPFYIDNFKMSVTIDGVTRELIEEVDFSFALEYVAGVRSTGKVIYGGIVLHDITQDGYITFNQYQTVGGEEVIDRNYVISFLADTLYNPVTTIWDNVINKPDTFPPTPHYEDYDSFYGQEEVVDGLGGIRDAILAIGDRISAEIYNALINKPNTIDFDYLKLSGGRLSGPLVLASEPNSINEATTKKYVDDLVKDSINKVLSNPSFIDLLNNKLSISGGTMTGQIVLASDPTADMHPVTKQYLSTVIRSQETKMLDFATKAFVESKFDELKNLLEDVLVYGVNNDAVVVTA